MTTDNISELLQRVKEGRDDEATAGLWEKYFDKLVHVARRNIASLPKRAADEEDVALSAINSFFRAAEAGRLSNLQNRDELWKMLVTMVIRKANRQKDKAFAKKRGGGDVRGESIFMRPCDEASPGLAGMAGSARNAVRDIEMADYGRVDPCVWRSSTAIRPNGPWQVSLGQRPRFQRHQRILP